MFELFRYLHVICRVWDFFDSIKSLLLLGALILVEFYHGDPSYGRCFFFSSAQTRYPLTGIFPFNLRPPLRSAPIRAAFYSYYFPRIKKYIFIQIYTFFHKTLLEYSQNFALCFSFLLKIWCHTLLHCICFLLACFPSTSFILAFLNSVFRVKSFLSSHMFLFSILFFMFSLSSFSCFSQKLMFLKQNYVSVRTVIVSSSTIFLFVC